MRSENTMAIHDFGVGVVAACTALVMYLYPYMILQRLGITLPNVIELGIILIYTAVFSKLGKKYCLCKSYYIGYVIVWCLIGLAWIICGGGVACNLLEANLG